MAFCLGAATGRPGILLAVGAGLGFAFAILVAAFVASLGGPSEPDCVTWCSTSTPREAFTFALGIAILVYPGWALGAGIGGLMRLSGYFEDTRIH